MIACGALPRPVTASESDSGSSSARVRGLVHHVHRHSRRVLILGNVSTRDAIRLVDGSKRVGTSLVKVAHALDDEDRLKRALLLFPWVGDRLIEGRTPRRT